MRTWRTEVARLLEQTAQALHNRNDRAAVSAFGTAVAYLQKAREQGEPLAGELLAQTREAPVEDETARFTFAPGELEAIRRVDKKS